MSIVLKLSLQEAIRCLHVKGYVDGVSKCTTISTAGSVAVADPKCTTDSTADFEGVQSGSGGQALGAGTKPGRRSVCEALREVVEAKVEAGLSAQCVYQDLVTDHGFGDSYESVKRFVRKLKARRPARVWRTPARRRRWISALRHPSSMSRANGPGRGCCVWCSAIRARATARKAVLRQDTETFLRVLENAIRSFGGAPLTLSVDNLKAAVTKADWYDPEINPKLAEFCRHYGVSVLPCRPYTPQHKGKVERGVGYVKENALKGRVFKSLREQNQHLLHWEAAVADKRIHGTTRQQVEARFEQERPHLLPLPESLFPCFMEAQRNVSRDGFVEVAKAYYEAPPELIGRKVWVRWDARCVRIFNERMEQVAMHTRLEPGRFSRSLGAGGWSTPVRGTCKHWVSQASVLGEHCGQWAQAAADARGPEAIRAIMGVCRLVKKHSATAVDAACAKALRNGSHSYKGIKALLGQEVEQAHLGFAESHPLIRNLGAYSDFINQTQTQTQTQNETNDTSNQHPQTPCAEAAPVRAA